MIKVNFKKGGRIAAFLSSNWLILLIVFLVFIFIRPILEWIKTLSQVTGGAADKVKSFSDAIGITDSDAKRNYKAEQINNMSPFNVNYYKNADSGSYLLTHQYAVSLSNKIHDALGYITKDYSALLSSFKELHAKTQVSYLADIFQQTYNQDLLNYIKPFSAWDFRLRTSLTDSQFTEINDYVNSLP